MDAEHAAAEQRHYRALICIEYLDAEQAVLWVPSWNPHRSVVCRPPPEGLLAFLAGDTTTEYVFGWAAIGASSPRAVAPRGPWEPAPVPTTEEEIAMFGHA
jgi:hypothetical protein